MRGAWLFCAPIRTIISHLEAIEPLVLWRGDGARRLVLEDLDDLVLGRGVVEGGDADLRHEVARDLAAVERVLARDDQLARRRRRLEAARPDDGCSQVHRRGMVDGRDGGMGRKGKGWGGMGRDGEGGE